MLTLKTAPAALALDWATEVKGHLRLDSEAERARIESVLIPAAEQYVEAQTNRQLVTATWTYYLDDFPCSGEPIELPKPPLQSVTTVKYRDTAGVLQTWAASNYSIETQAGPYALPGRIVPNWGVLYPSVYGQPNDVAIEFIAGYGATYAAVPPLLKAALLLLVAEQFEQREESISGTSINRIPLGVSALLWPFRVWL